MRYTRADFGPIPVALSLSHELARTSVAADADGRQETISTARTEFPYFIK
ncbi:hypothetical protein GCM10009730_37710 [Streptomyces albidochromogenes]